MVEIIGVRFKSVGKTYSFSPAGQTFRKGDHVVVETAHGLECGEVTFGNREVDEAELVMPLKSIVRAATPDDLRRAEENVEKEARALRVCQERISAHNLEMKLVDVEYAFDGSKILFYFTADGRVDFRELVKDLASVFHTRIELRQIGVRDEAKMLGGLGICGQPFCCAQFLPDFQPVSIKMAKEQGLSLNPTKISGSCGRLMCCLKYEQSTYVSLSRMTPRQGTQVSTPDGAGVVTDANVLTGVVKVRLHKSPDSPPVAFSRDDLTWLGAPPREPKPEEPAEPVESAELADLTEQPAPDESADVAAPEENGAPEQSAEPAAQNGDRRPPYRRGHRPPYRGHRPRPQKDRAEKQE